VVKQSPAAETSAPGPFTHQTVASDANDSQQDNNPVQRGSSTTFPSGSTEFNIWPKIQNTDFGRKNVSLSTSSSVQDAFQSAQATFSRRLAGRSIDSLLVTHINDLEIDPIDVEPDDTQTWWGLIEKLHLRDNAAAAEVKATVVLQMA
jgi:hypothetical protein